MANALASLISLVTSARAVNRVPETHTNRAGGQSYWRSLKEQVIQVLTTGTLGDTYYCTGQQLAQEAVEVLLKAREECPDFFARALVYARNVGMMKTLPVLGLVVLSGGRKNRKLTEAVFDQVVRIPDDLRAFVALCRTKSVPGRDGFGGYVVQLVRRKLTQMSEYHVLKYGSSASDTITLCDILRLSHAKPIDPAQSERFAWLVNGDNALGTDPTLNPQIQALASLKRAVTEDEKLNLIREGKLPFEVVVPTLQGTSPKIWEALLYNAPYMNLLWSLATFARHGVFQSEANVRYAVQRLINPQAVERSRVLPFRFFNAWKVYSESEGSRMEIADALRQAMELSFVNMPTLGERTVAIGADTSGSMCGTYSERSSTRFIDIAGIFTGALLKRIEGRAIALPFDTEVHVPNQLSARDDILVTAEKLSRYGGGGTAVGSPIEHLLRSNSKVDVFVGITDSEDWAYGRGYRCSGSFYELWLRYREVVNPDAKAFLVTIAPYRDALVPDGVEGVHFISGWSDRVLNYIGLTLEGGENQIQAIEQMELDVGGRANDSTETDNEEHAEE